MFGFSSRRRRFCFVLLSNFRKDLEKRRNKTTSPSHPEAGACPKRFSGIPSSATTAGPADHELLTAARKAESNSYGAADTNYRELHGAPWRPDRARQLGSKKKELGNRPCCGGSGNCSTAVKSNPALSSKVAEITQKFRF